MEVYIYIYRHEGLVFILKEGEDTIQWILYGTELDSLGLRETTSSTPKYVIHTHISSSVGVYNSTLLPRHCKCIASSVRGFRLRSKIPRQRYE